MGSKKVEFKNPDAAASAKNKADVDRQRHRQASEEQGRTGSSSFADREPMLLETGSWGSGPVAASNRVRERDGVAAGVAGAAVEGVVDDDRTGRSAAFEELEDVGPGPGVWGPKTRPRS